MNFVREIRDPVHNFIKITDIESKIIDSVIFQRLRRIKQLAMAYLVYPGALHTRFEHSLGTMQVAGRMAERLLEGDEEKIQSIRIAALLHDVGHGPFSHVSENILEKYYAKDKIQPKAKEKIHELLSFDIIKNSEEIKTIFAENSIDMEFILNIISANIKEPILENIISGPLDADKQDYLLRDNYFCGVKYGIYDIERLISILKQNNDGYFNWLAIDCDGINTIEQFILAKHFMTTQIYRHKVRLISDAMIIRALELGIEKDNLSFLKELYTYNGSKEYILNYLLWDDSKLINSIINESEKSYSKNIFINLLNRNLLKRIYSKPIAEFSDNWIKKYIKNINKRNVEKKLTEHLNVKGSLSLDENHLIINIFSFKSLLGEKENSIDEIIVIKEKNGENFSKVSSLFGAINQKEADSFFEIYAPAQCKIFLQDENNKREFIEKVEEMLKDEISSLMKK